MAPKRKASGTKSTGAKRRKPSQGPSRRCRTNASKARDLGSNLPARVSKDILYMILALWMEDFVDEQHSKCRKIGAVLVLPNDVVWAADCSRDGVHAVARLLMKHYEKAEGSKMFVSRKPCPTCAKLQVQSKVKRVLYLPREPEYHRLRTCRINDRKKNQVDNLFTASSIAQTIFTLQVEEPVLDNLDQKIVEKKGSRLTPKEKNELKRGGKNLLLKYFPESTWWKSVEKELPWSLLDRKTKTNVKKSFGHAMDWMAKVQFLSGKGSECHFTLSVDSKPSDPGDFDPTVDNTDHKKQARHFMAMARFLAERTDDPTTGVGAVIVSPDMEILALGWNGYPLKAHYGEFARGGKQSNKEKYPYVIHAEQSALLTRNTKNIQGSILFVTKSPCGECAPLIKKEGIKTIVTDDDRTLSNPRHFESLDYRVFLKMVKDKKFVCFQTQKSATPYE